MTKPQFVLWSGLVDNIHCTIYHDGRTTKINKHGLTERVSDANPIVAAAVSQLVSRLESAEALVLKNRFDKRRF